jgi:hypothetical protein
MVDMHVRQQHGYDLVRRKRRAIEVPILKLPLLKHAAVDQYLLAGDVKQIPAAGDLSAGTEEVEFHGDRDQESGVQELFNLCYCGF